MPPYLPQIKAGKIRALAVTSAKRSPPCRKSRQSPKRVSRDYDVGRVVRSSRRRRRRKTSSTSSSRRRSAFCKLPDVKSRLADHGAEPVGSTPEQFGAHIKAEIAKWAKVIKEASVELQ